MLQRSRPDHDLFGFLPGARPKLAPRLLAEIYYKSHRAKDRSHNRSLRCLGQRWLRIIHKMWMDRTPYNPELHHRNQVKHGSWVFRFQETKLQLICTKKPLKAPRTSSVSAKSGEFQTHIRKLGRNRKIFGIDRLGRNRPGQCLLAETLELFADPSRGSLESFLGSIYLRAPSERLYESPKLFEHNTRGNCSCPKTRRGTGISRRPLLRDGRVDPVERRG
jgi:hypothetical protein